MTAYENDIGVSVWRTREAAAASAWRGGEAA